MLNSFLKLKTILIFVITFILNTSFVLIAQQKKSNSFIRINQIGYLADDQKIAVIGSEDNLVGSTFYLVEADKTNSINYTGKISTDRGNHNSPFKHIYSCDFSDVKTEGEYKIKLADGTLSQTFRIGALKNYQNALGLVLNFFRSQRCGDIDPVLHTPCHLNDANALIDVSGGWHDAGDYIKYMITVTFTTLEMVTAADYAITYKFENAMVDAAPKNGFPDLLDEVKVGLDWILKMTSDYSNGNYYYQVSGEEDHNGWRMPEDDDEERDKGKSRSLHKGWGGNILGKSAASLAIAFRVFQNYDEKYAKKCLTRAEALFADRADYEKVQKSIPEDFYNERTWLDDMVLCAAELFQSTKKEVYLNYTKDKLKKLSGDDISWNGSDFLAYASCSKSNIERDYVNSKMKEILKDKKKSIEEDPFYLSSEYAWGTTAMFTADAQKAIMYYYLTSDTSYLNLATAERDYLLGRNNWGVSFVIGLGSVYPLHAHSQLNSLAGLQKGAIVGGPAEKKDWIRIFPDLKIENDLYAAFQGEIIYYDQQEDYYCNEVALDYTVPSIFIFLHVIGKELNSEVE